jgi:hypothetical protein
MTIALCGSLWAMLYRREPLNPFENERATLPGHGRTVHEFWLSTAQRPTCRGPRLWGVGGEHHSVVPNMAVAMWKCVIEGGQGNRAGGASAGQVQRVQLARPAAPRGRFLPAPTSCAGMRQCSPRVGAPSEPIAAQHPTLLPYFSLSLTIPVFHNSSLLYVLRYCITLSYCVLGGTIWV